MVKECSSQTSQTLTKCLKSVLASQTIVEAAGEEMYIVERITRRRAPDYFFRPRLLLLHEVRRPSSLALLAWLTQTCVACPAHDALIVCHQPTSSRAGMR